MHIGIVPSVLAALLMGVAAIRFAARDDEAGAVIATFAAMLAILAAVEAGSADHGGNESP
jgi:hypothetical protein